MRSLPFFLVFLALLLASRTAGAEPRSKWVSAVVPLHPRNDGGMAVIPLTAPSREHPLGTVAIFGQNVVDIESEGEADRMLMAYAWDLDVQKVIATKPIAKLPCHRSVVSAVRDGARILLIAGGHDYLERPHENVTLFTIDESLDVVSREVLGVGDTPSIAISERWIVAGFFEKRSTAIRPEGMRHMDMRLALHAVVLDRATHAVVDARVFQGARLLAPAPQTWLSTHAFAVHGEDLFVSLPGEAEATIVKARLPSLTPVKTRVLDRFMVAFGCSPIHVVDDNLVVVTPLGWRLLTFQLDLRAHTFDRLGEALAWNPKRATLLASGAQGKGLPWSSLALDEPCSTTIWAWDRPVALCTGQEESDESASTPMRLFRLR